MKNSELVIQILDQLHAQGVEEICLCSGSRNAPFFGVLTAHPGLFRVYSFFEERSAAFFALGRIRKSNRPVAVITTSGTAVGELLPATMEGYYSGLPLVLLTADRPRTYRNSGAPQAAEQVGIFGVYVSHSLDFDETEKVILPQISRRPIHLNVCFDEPLLDSDFHMSAKEKVVVNRPQIETQADAQIQLQKFFAQNKYPFAIVAGLHSDEREAVVELLLRLNVPVYLEALSGIREDARLNHLRIHFADRLVDRAKKADYPIDSVIRLGGIPTHRVWRDLESKTRHLSVLSLSPRPFSGLGRPSQFIVGEFSKFLEVLPSGYPSASRFLEADRLAWQKVQFLFAQEPLSEPALIGRLGAQISEGSQVFIGNSLPIREWDLAVDYKNRNIEVWASRGVNGIDGQISTFLGVASSSQENWALIGDLTALYDLTGLWVLNQLQSVRAQVVIVNNGGGKIFDRMFPMKEFQNQHQTCFQPWAQLWGLAYEHWTDIPENLGGAQNRIIELVPDAESTRRFWEACVLV